MPLQRQCVVQFRRRKRFLSQCTGITRAQLCFRPCGIQLPAASLTGICDFDKARHSRLKRSRTRCQRCTSRRIDVSVVRVAAFSWMPALAMELTKYYRAKLFLALLCSFAASTRRHPPLLQRTLPLTSLSDEDFWHPLNSAPHPRLSSNSLQAGHWRSCEPSKLRLALAWGVKSAENTRNQLTLLRMLARVDN